MINVIRYLREKDRIVLRQMPGKGDRECIILVPRTVIRPGVVVETCVPVEVFKSKFLTPAALKTALSNSGYFELARELEKDGVL